MLGNLSLALPWWLCAGPPGNGEQLQHVQSLREFVMALMAAHVEPALTQHFCCAGLQCLALVEQCSKAARQRCPIGGGKRGKKAPQAPDSGLALERKHAMLT